MISEGDIKNILIDRVKSDDVLGAITEIVKDRHAPVDKNNVSERIVIVIPGGIDNSPLSRSYPRICIYVPYLNAISRNMGKYNVPNSKRLVEIEKRCIGIFRSGIFGRFDSEAYLFKIEDINQEDDPETFSTFINVKLKFEVINTLL